MSQARPPPPLPPPPPPAADLHDDAGGWRCPEAVEAGRSRSQWEIGGRWAGLEGRLGHIYYSGVRSDWTWDTQSQDTPSPQPELPLILTAIFARPELDNLPEPEPVKQRDIT